MDIAAPVCVKCKHFHGIDYLKPYEEVEDGFGCDAFPKGIPAAILEDGDKHRRPLPGQGNDIVFEPKT